MLLHHSVVNYTHFGTGDKARWLGFDLIVLFNDSFFMACMFLISGLFVCESLTQRGPLNFLANRAWRLGIPFLVSIFVLMPIAYYPTFLRYHLPGTTDFNFFHFWGHIFTVGPWPSGPAWFLWVLLAFDAIAALVWRLAPNAIPALGRAVYALRYRPGFAFIPFLVFSIVVYLPMRLYFGDAAWYELDNKYPLPIQTSRIFLYSGYFLVGVGIGAADLRSGIFAENGELARALEDLARRRAGLLRRDPAAGLRPPQLGGRLQCAAAVMARRLRAGLRAVQRRDGIRRAGLLPALCKDAAAACSMRCGRMPTGFSSRTTSSSSGCNTQSTTRCGLPFVKFAIVFAGTLAGSWALTVVLRKMPVIGRMI